MEGQQSTESRQTPDPVSNPSPDTSPVETPDVTILIPAYNEAEALGPTLESLKPYAAHYREVLVVDDGSTDNTAEVARAHGARVVVHPVNRGYGAALKTGSEQAHTRYVLMFDADGQHPAEAIPDFTRDAGQYDIALGMRVRGSDAALARRPGKWILKVVADKLAGQKIPDLNCGMRLVDRALLLQYRAILPEGFSLSTTMTIASLKDRYRVQWVPLKTEARAGRPSNVRIFQDGFNTLLLILRVIMLFDPLKIFLPVSGLLFTMGMLIFIFESVVYRLQLTQASVFALLSSVLVFLFGLVADQLAALRRQIR